MTQKKKVSDGLWIALVGVGIFFAPVIFALAIALLTGGLWKSDGSQDSGAALWLMFISVPVGGTVFLVGLVIAAVTALRNRAK
jgi:uncharacterized membrane protein YgdD (TMEM256/DUF423 family)